MLMLILGEIIEKLKDVLSESKVGTKVFDKDVATALNIPQATFATMKKRNSIPYEEILEFCALKKISVNWLFFDQAVEQRQISFFKYVILRIFVQVQGVVLMVLMKTLKPSRWMRRSCIIW